MRRRQWKQLLSYIAAMHRRTIQEILEIPDRIELENREASVLSERVGALERRADEQDVRIRDAAAQSAEALRHLDAFLAEDG